MEVNHSVQPVILLFCGRLIPGILRWRLPIWFDGGSDDTWCSMWRDYVEISWYLEVPVDVWHSGMWRHAVLHGVCWAVCYSVEVLAWWRMPRWLASPTLPQYRSLLSLLQWRWKYLIFRVLLFKYSTYHLVWKCLYSGFRYTVWWLRHFIDLIFDLMRLLLLVEMQFIWYVILMIPLLMMIRYSCSFWSREACGSMQRKLNEIFSDGNWYVSILSLHSITIDTLLTIVLYDTLLTLLLKLEKHSCFIVVAEPDFPLLLPVPGNCREGLMIPVLLQWYLPVLIRGDAWYPHSFPWYIVEADEWYYSDITDLLLHWWIHCGRAMHSVIFWWKWYTYSDGNSVGSGSIIPRNAVKKFVPYWLHSFGRRPFPGDYHFVTILPLFDFFWRTFIGEFWRWRLPILVQRTENCSTIVVTTFGDIFCRWCAGRAIQWSHSVMTFCHSMTMVNWKWWLGDAFIGEFWCIGGGLFVHIVDVTWWWEVMEAWRLMHSLAVAGQCGCPNDSMMMSCWYWLLLFYWLMTIVFWLHSHTILQLW